MKKKWWTILIIIAVIILAIAIIKTRGNGVSKQTTECIGQNSVLYTQFGCYACAIQQEMFSNNYKYLNVVDCFYEIEKCSEIQASPTWVINGKKYRGVQSIEKLKEVTGC